MEAFIEISLFWVAVFVAIWLLSRFPESWLGRVLFAHQGPLPVRGEARSRYQLRWAKYAAGWFLQALLVLLVGWGARGLDPSLGDELFFQVFWTVIVPLAASVALLGSLCALTASLWRRYLGAERRERRGSHPARA